MHDCQIELIQSIWQKEGRIKGKLQCIAFNSLFVCGGRGLVSNKHEIYAATFGSHLLLWLHPHWLPSPVFPSAYISQWTSSETNRSGSSVSVLNSKSTAHLIFIYVVFVTFRKKMMDEKCLKTFLMLNFSDAVHWNKFSSLNFSSG